MPAGSNTKREREFRQLVSKFKADKRYRGRETEVASRIVNKQRAQYGETRRARKEETEGRSPDRSLPIENYRHLRIDEIIAKVNHLRSDDIRKLMSYERSHKKRQTLLNKLKQRLH